MNSGFPFKDQVIKSFFDKLTPPILSEKDKIGGVSLFYTKHHLKFGKNQADNLEYIGFRRRFFPVFYWCLVLLPL